MYGNNLFNTCIVTCLQHRNLAINLLYICHFMQALCYFRSVNVNYIITHTTYMYMLQLLVNTNASRAEQFTLSVTPSDLQAGGSLETIYILLVIIQYIDNKLLLDKS